MKRKGGKIKETYRNSGSRLLGSIQTRARRSIVYLLDRIGLDYFLDLGVESDNLLIGLREFDIGVFGLEPFNGRKSGGR